jgi:hypothetical protein
MAPEVIPIDSTEVLEAHEFDIPCQFSGRDGEDCPDLPARWVLYSKQCPDCGEMGSAVLTCDPCKEARLMDLCCIECDCGHVWYNAPDAYSRIEPLNRVR